jgi:hypothetical protein
MLRTILIAALLAAPLLAFATPADANIAVCHGNVTGIPVGNEACGLRGFCSQPNVDCAQAIDHDYGCNWDTRTAAVNCGLQ